MLEFNAFDDVRLMELTRTAIAEVLRLTALNVWGESRREAPVDHGRLAGSIQLERQDELSYRIFSGVEYALAVHEGTRPHEIRPVNKEALWWPGAEHPVKCVMHPGTPPNPFMRRAMATTEGRLEEFMRRAIEHAEATIR